MSDAGKEHWFRKILEPIGRMMGSFVRPWTELNAVKSNQVDIVAALSAQQADIANALVQIRKIRQDIDRLDLSVARHEDGMRQLFAPSEAIKQNVDAKNQD